MELSTNPQGERCPLPEVIIASEQLQPVGKGASRFAYGRIMQQEIFALGWNKSPGTGTESGRSLPMASWAVNVNTSISVHCNFLVAWGYTAPGHHRFCFVLCLLHRQRGCRRCQILRNP